jgi:hypothetical protein
MRSASESRTRSSSFIESTRGPPPGAATPKSMPVRGKADPKSRPSSASIAAIWRLRSDLAARSSLS